MQIRIPVVLVRMNACCMCVYSMYAGARSFLSSLCVIVRKQNRLGYSQFILV